MIGPIKLSLKGFNSHAGVKSAIREWLHKQAKKYEDRVKTRHDIQVEDTNYDNPSNENIEHNT